ncbi:hypothetical protein [Streptomyces sp. HPF1205]|uniref:hypothetical protein n=1 Tax=Streptomyces sp. HPF1205 TaxID=2873262 RepID=UPI001CEC4C00|nr:hypothetical protein [Streptomyces sp. HPF1205]
MPIRARSRLLTSSRTVLVAAALLPALALTAACGGGSSASDPSRKENKDSSPTAKFSRALLANSDVPDVTVVPAADKAQLLGAEVTAEPRACQPIADQWSEKAKHARQVYSGGMVTDTATKVKASKTISLEVIASYAPGEAKAVLDELTAALAACHNYTVTRNKVASTFSVQPAPSSGAPMGDQQVTYTVADTSRGAAGIVLVTVVRVGDTTAAYETVRQDHQPAVLRAAIPLKQVAKLRAAAKGAAKAK